MGEKEKVVLVSVFILLLLAVSIITLIVVFVKRKNRLLEEQATIKEMFKIELAKSQVEIREETLRNISWELHDNIGQLISLAKINAQLAKKDPSKTAEVVEILGKGLNELRALSKSINPQAISEMSFIEAIETEIARYNRLEYIHSTLNIKGVEKELNSNKEIILFRILQEFFSNTVKHAKATKLEVELIYSNGFLVVKAKDNGRGFDTSTNSNGIGLKNMENRAKLINSDFEIRSVSGEGTSLHLRVEL